MKRLLIKLPNGLTLDHLSSEQQAAIVVVDAQYVLPCPGTISFGTEEYIIDIPEVIVDDVITPASTITLIGMQILDAVVDDSFDAEKITLLNLPFTILGAWWWNGVNATPLEELIPLDSSFINYLPAVNTYNENNEITGTAPPTLHIPHKWSGWPDVNL